jgi:hypothetical protein
MPPQSPPAGWYSDPEGAGVRWWDGERWTEHTHSEAPSDDSSFSDARPVQSQGNYEFEKYFSLAGGETIDYTCRPAKFPLFLHYILSLGLYEFWRRVHLYAVTDRRMVERRGLLINKSEVSLPLLYVQDAAIETALWWGRVNVSTAGASGGSLQTRWVSKQEARVLRSTILNSAHRMPMTIR